MTQASQQHAHHVRLIALQISPQTLNDMVVSRCLQDLGLCTCLCHLVAKSVQTIDISIIATCFVRSEGRKDLGACREGRTIVEGSEGSCISDIL